jgi:hypothetical protein
MKQLILAAFALCLCLIPAPALAAEKNVFDQVPCSGSVSTSAACNTSGNPITGTDGSITKVTTLIAYIAGVAAVLIIIIGGVMYVLSGGDQAKVTAAKDTILYAVIGLVVVILARTIIVFVIGKIK